MKTLKKFNEFLLEAKEEVVSMLLKMLDEKPKIGDSVGIYTISDIKKYFRENGKSNLDVDNAMHQVFKDKSLSSKVKKIHVRNHRWNENMPCYYMGLTDDEANKLKLKSEEISKEKKRKEIEGQKPTPISKTTRTKARKNIKSKLKK